VMAQVLYCFPHALMILVTALGLADGRLYEAAAAMGTPRWRVFTTVTLPSVRYGLISAAFVVFTLVMTDFGIAKVIGGQFNVLATDAYKQMIGQQNFAMGAVVGGVLLLPAVLAFAFDRHVQRRPVALLAARAVPLQPKRNRFKDASLAAYCLLVGGVITAVLAVSVWGSFVAYWPYNLSLSLRNYDFEAFEPNGIGPYFTSLKMAALAATLGTMIVFGGAYLIEKGQGFRMGRAWAHVRGRWRGAGPGRALGPAASFLTSPSPTRWGVLSGTPPLLPTNPPPPFSTRAPRPAVTALKQIDNEFESVSASLKVPF